MNEGHSQGRKALLSIICIALSSTLSLGFSDIAISSSDSAAAVYSLPVQSAEAVLRQDIAAYAKNYLGLKYRYAGRSPETGFDCSGFTHFVMGTFGISLSPSSVQQSLQGEPIKVKETQTGDLIFFRRSARSRISHVAMVVSNDENGIFIIHSTSRGIVIDDLMESAYWRPKIYSARRVINAQKEEIMSVILAVSECTQEGATEVSEKDEIEAQLNILDERFYCLEPLPALPLREIKP